MKIIDKIKTKTKPSLFSTIVPIVIILASTVVVTFILAALFWVFGDAVAEMFP